MRLANIVATACAPLLVFATGGAAWFLGFSSLVYVSTAGVGNTAGAVTGLLFGGLWRRRLP